MNEERLKIQREALDALKANNYRGIVILPTGTGKTYVLIEALKELFSPGMTVLYTCDSQRLRDTDFNNELDKWNAGEFKDVIEKQCYASAYKYSGKHYNILLADEGDYGLTPAYSKLFTENTFDYIIFVSATLEREKRKIASDILPPVVYERKMKEIEEKSVINKSRLWLVPYMLTERENKDYLGYNRRFSTLLQQPKSDTRDKQLQFLTLERLHFLGKLQSSAYICRKLLAELEEAEEGKTLIFCNSTQQADRICDFSYHSKSNPMNLDLFNAGAIDALTVCGKVDRGINLVGVNRIIMEFTTRSETKAVQKLGRGKRLGVDDLLDVYFLVPYFKKFGDKKAHPTIVLSKIQEACKELGIENAKTYIVK